MLAKPEYIEPPAKPEVIWEPHVGSQTLFLSSPFREVLYDGTRGNGKTDAILMDFAQDCGKGYGVDWRGILFRETYDQLKDVIYKSQKFFDRIFPSPIADYNQSNHTWRWATGEELRFSYMKDIRDYNQYHGHEFPWIGWEELTNWKDDKCYEVMKSCNRSSKVGMRRRYVSTTNSYGKGHGWVKRWFVDPAPEGCIPILGSKGWTRIRIQGYLLENTHLMESDPDYFDWLRNIKEPMKRKAWFGASWDIQADGAIADLWDERIHYIPLFHIPSSWYVDRSLDWGSTHPYSVGWWAESNGSKVEVSPGKFYIFPKGTLFRINELYGWTGKENEGNKQHASSVARKIKEREIYFSYRGKIKSGPADNQIYNSDRTLAADMTAMGVQWKEADQSPGSRVAGLEQLRTMLSASLAVRSWQNTRAMESPGLFIFNNCLQWKRTVPPLQRSEKDMDDVEKDGQEDHCYDETRYRILTRKIVTTRIEV